MRLRKEHDEPIDADANTGCRRHALADRFDELFIWTLNFGSIALIWRADCIIRSQFLNNIKEAFDGYRSERLPANLLQAQRDYFGAHTFERVDKPRNQFFHTNWTGNDSRFLFGLNNFLN